MQITTKAKTPKEARDEISALLKYKACIARECAEKHVKKTEREIYTAVFQELQSMADFVDAITDGAN